MSFVEVDGNWPNNAEAWDRPNVVLLCPECLYVVVERDRCGFYAGLPLGLCFCPRCGSQIATLKPVTHEEIQSAGAAIRGETEFRSCEAVAIPVPLSWWAAILHDLFDCYPKIRWRLRRVDYDRIMFVK